MRQRLPALGGGSCLSGAPCMSTGPKARRALQGIGEGQGVPNDSERGDGQSSRPIGPMAGPLRLRVGKVGTRCPRDPLEGRRSRASRFSGRTSGRYAGLTNRIQALNNVCHVLDSAFVRDASRQTWKSSAPGVDKVTAAQEAANLDENLRDLHEQRRANR